MTDQRTWYAGVDWGSQNHQVVLTDHDGRKIGEKAFKHSGEGLRDMAAWLLSASGAVDAAQVLVAIEVPHGPVVEALIERGFKLFVINPKQLDRFRDRFGVSGAKDDSRDALVAASAVRTDRHLLRALERADPAVVELREWSRIAEEIGAERVRLANQMRDQLWRYFPAILDLDDDLGAEWLLELWETAPTPAKAARLREAKIANLLKRNRIRRLDGAQVLAILRQPPLQVAAGTTEAASAHIATLIARIRLINRQIKEAHRRIDELTDRLSPETEPGQDEQHDAKILASLPGIGRINRATLLAEGHDALQRRDHAALRILAGVAPVTKQSGKSRIVHRRLARHHRIANAVYHWARVAVQHDSRSREKYDALRKRGHNHARALRSVGDRLLGVACAMLKAGTLYDPKFGDEQQA